MFFNRCSRPCSTGSCSAAVRTPKFIWFKGVNTRRIVGSHIPYFGVLPVEDIVQV